MKSSMKKFLFILLQGLYESPSKRLQAADEFFKILIDYYNPMTIRRNTIYPLTYKALNATKA